MSNDINTQFASTVRTMRNNLPTTAERLRQIGVSAQIQSIEESVLGIAEELLNGGDFSAVYQFPREQFIAATKDLENVCNYVNSLNLNDQSENAIAEKRRVTADFERKADSWLGQAMTMLWFMTTGDRAVTRERQRVNAKLSEMEQKMHQWDQFSVTSRSQFESVRKEIGELAGEARNLVASNGVQQHSEGFTNVRKRHEYYALLWLSGAIGCVSYAVYFAITYAALNKLTEIKMDATTIDHYATRVFVLVVLVTVALWCFRMFRITQNLAEIARHRAVSLDTFERFIASARSSEVRDEVLLAAARTIFGHVPSGLVTVGDEDSRNTLEIASTVANLAKGGKS